MPLRFTSMHCSYRLVAWAMFVGSGLGLGGCCLTTVSGGTGNYLTGTGGVSGTTSTSATGGGSTTGTRRATSSGGFVCDDTPANLSNFATYSLLPLAEPVSADLNGDGLLDLVVLRVPDVITQPPTLPAAPGLEVFLALSDGGLGAPTEYPETDSQAVAVGDLNGDGAPDVVVSNQAAIQILLNGGSGTLTPLPPINLPGVSDIEYLGIADFNGDGLADIVVNENAYAGGQTLAILFAQSPVVFSQPSVVSLIGGGLSSSLLVSDLNQDGLPDIVVNSSDGSLAVYLNQGDGGFKATLYPVIAAWQLISVPRAGGGPDLVFGLASSPGGLQLLKNLGDGSFSVGPVYPVAALWLSVGDFNGDCIPDIVTLQGAACPTGPSNVFVLYGDGDGGFEAPVTLPSPEHANQGIALLGEVTDPRAFGVVDACGIGVAVYGDTIKK